MDAKTRKLIIKTIKENLPYLTDGELAEIAELCGVTIIDSIGDEI